MRFTSRTLQTVGFLLLAGCASVPEKGGFDEVEKLVQERAAKKIVWNQGSAEDREVLRLIQEMLQKELTADDVVQIALLNNRRLQAAYEDLGIAQADLVQAGLLRNPTLGLEMRFPGDPRPPLEVHVIQSFLELLSLSSRKRAAEASFEGTKFRVTHAVLHLAAEARSAFVKLQGASQMLELRQRAAQASEASLEAATRIHEAGNITDLDLANEQAMASQAKLDLAMIESEIFTLREELNSLMGLWGSETAWSIGQRLPELPSEELPLEGLESWAILQRLDLAAAQREMRSAAESVGIAQLEGILPDLEIGAHLEREPDGTSSFGPSLDFTLPIFNQGQPATSAAQARLRQSAQQYAALAIEIRSEVRRSWNQMRTARSRAEYYLKKVIPLRQRITEETQLEYNAMLVGVFQLLQAKQGEIEAGRGYVEAMTDYWSASANLEKALGGPLHQEPKHVHGGVQ